MKLYISILYYAFLLWPLETISNLLDRKRPGTCQALTYHIVTRKQRERFAWQMDCLLRHATPVSLEALNQLGDGIHHVAVTFDDGYHCLIENTAPELGCRGIPATVFVPSGWLGQTQGWTDDAEHQGQAVMTGEELKELLKLHVIIGSHCVTHRRLSAMTREEVREELVNSRRELESLTGRKVCQLSFPFGDYLSEHIEDAHKAGYNIIVGILPWGISRSVIGRIDVSPDNWRLEFYLKMKGAYQWLPLAVVLKRRLNL